MESTKLVKGIVKGYFFGALALSAVHIVEAFEKLGLNTGEQYATPLMIDGIAVLGLVMRGEKWSSDTRRVGLRVQVGAGILSLAANVFAGSSIGGRLVGVLIVGLFLLAEWMSDRMVSLRAEQEAEAIAEAERVTLAEAERIEAERARKNEAARLRRQASKTAKHSAEVSEARRIAKAAKALATR